MFDKMMAGILTRADRLPLILKVPLKLLVGLSVLVYLAGSLGLRTLSAAAAGLWKLPMSRLRHH